MCGISCTIGSDAVRVTSESIHRLKNRGYDSVGMTWVTNGEKYTFRTLSYDDFISTANEQPGSELCMAHTRWATHGERTVKNCHPHESNNGLFSIVHNGIIDNCDTLKSKLKENGYTFYSDTDSEVIANLIQYFFVDDVLNALRHVVKAMSGTWGLCVLYSNEPDSVYCLRRGSPLLVGEGTDKRMIVSEQFGFDKSIHTFSRITNDSICRITRDDFVVYDGNVIDTKSYSREFEYSKGEYDHWMLKEILEQPKVIQQVLNFGGRIPENRVRLGGLSSNVPSCDHIMLIGCGSSYNACIYASREFKNRTGKFVSVIDAANFMLSDIPHNVKTCAIFVSQSGETRDVYTCIGACKNAGCFTVGVTNVPDSLIANEVDCGCYINAGREFSVASTKSFTAQCTLLVLIASWFGDKTVPPHIPKLSDDFKKMIEHCQRDIRYEHLQKIDTKSIFVLASGEADYAIAREGALKIKEITYLHAEGFMSSDLKHGPFAMLDESISVILIDTDAEKRERAVTCYREIKSRKTPILVFTTDKDHIFGEDAIVFDNPHVIIVFQYIAYTLSVMKNINPDEPRNLAKVVTVD